MDMSLLDEFTPQLQKVTEIIKSLTPIDRIYLAGWEVNHVYKESIFAGSYRIIEKPVHFLVIVFTAGDDMERHKLEERIEEGSDKAVMVTAIVLYTSEYNRWKEAGHLFVHNLEEKARILYERDAHDPALVPIDASSVRNMQHSIYERALNRGSEFLIAGDLCRLRKQFKMCAFMLHQGAEQFLSAIFHLRTGLYVQSHNLNKLLRFCSFATPAVDQIFPDPGTNRGDLLRLLNKAYIDARYKEDYRVSAKEIDVLSIMLRNLQAVLRSEFAIISGS